LSRRPITAARRRLHQPHHADDVEATLAGDPEVVDVEHGEVDAFRREQLRRVGRFARPADRQVDSVVFVEMPSRCAA